MPSRLVRSAWALLVVAAVGGLAVRAAADAWRAPALLPQRVGARGLRAVLDDPSLRAAATTTLAVAVAVSLAGLAVAWPAARAIGTAARPSRALVALLAAPVLLPGYALGTGIATLLLDIGLGRGAVAIAIAHLPVVVAYEVLVLAPALDGRLARLEEAARVLGAGPARRLVLAVAPAARRPVGVALALGAAVSAAQVGSSLAAGGGTPTLPVLLVPYVQADPQIAATLALLLALPAAGVLALASRAADDGA